VETVNTPLRDIFKSSGLAESSGDLISRLDALQKPKKYEFNKTAGSLLACHLRMLLMDANIIGIAPFFLKFLRAYKPVYRNLELI